MLPFVYWKSVIRRALPVALGDLGYSTMAAAVFSVLAGALTLLYEADWNLGDAWFKLRSVSGAGLFAAGSLAGLAFWRIVIVEPARMDAERLAEIGRLKAELNDQVQMAEAIRQKSEFAARHVLNWIRDHKVGNAWPQEPSREDYDVCRRYLDQAEANAERIAELTIPLADLRGALGNFQALYECGERNPLRYEHVFQRAEVAYSAIREYAARRRETAEAALSPA